MKTIVKGLGGDCQLLNELIIKVLHFIIMMINHRMSQRGQFGTGHATCHLPSNCLKDVYVYDYL